MITWEDALWNMWSLTKPMKVSEKDKGNDEDEDS